MSKVYIEYRRLDNVAISWDIAYHLYTRQQLNGRVAIVTENPSGLLAALRKQWLGIIRKLKRERSSTLRAKRSDELLLVIEGMENIPFKSESDADTLNAREILIIEPASLRAMKSVFHTIYLLSSEKQKDAISKLERHGLLVLYEKS